MRTVLAVIGWSLIGSVLAFFLTYTTLIIYVNLIAPRDNDWGTPLALLLSSPWLGLVLGAIYGLIRADRRRRP